MSNHLASMNIKLSGDIAIGGEVNLRDVANAFTHLQSMIDRAFIDLITHGKIRKHSRLTSQQYGEVFFSVQDPKRESYLVNMISRTEIGMSVIDRVNAAISPIYKRLESAVQSERHDIENDIKRIRTQIDNKIITVKEYNEEEIRTNKDFVRSFGDRSILKYMDQLVSPTRTKEKDNYVDLGLVTDRIYQYNFNKDKGQRFHSEITKKTLAAPRIITGQLVKADWHNLQGNFVKYTNGRKCNLKFSNRDEVEELSKLMGAKGITIIASPIIEFGSYDAESGDLQFISLINAASA